MSAIVLKYLAWFFGVGVSFLGTWFFSFTRSDDKTGRKHLTRFGKYALSFASLGILAALAITILADIEAADQRLQAVISADEAKRQASLAEQYKVDAANSRERLERNQRESKRLQEEHLATQNLLLSRIDEIYSADPVLVEEISRRTGDATVRVGVFSFREQYPDEFERFVYGEVEEVARAIDLIFSQTNAGIVELGFSRFVDTAECRSLGFEKSGGGQHLLSIQSQEQQVYFQVSAESKGVVVQVAEPNDPERKGQDQRVWNAGVTVSFDETVTLPCDSSLFPLSCSINLSEADSGPQIFSVMRDQLMESIHVPMGKETATFDVPREMAQTFRKAMNCVRL